MPGIGIVINPYSRSHRKDPRKAERLGFIVGDKGSCHTTKDLSDVEKLAAEFKHRKIEIVGISGGDGTIHKTLTTFINVYGNAPLPKIALLRGGTMNNLSNCLAIRGAPEKILSDLILKYHEDIPFEETEMDILKINNDYGFLLGMGLVSRFVDKYNLHKNGDPSPWRAFGMLTSAMISAAFNGKRALDLCERFDATITVDGITAPFKNYMMIFAGTMDNLGFHFRPLYRCRETPGMFQLVAISTTPRHLLFSFPQAFFGKPSCSEDYFDVMGSKAVLEFENPLVYTIDGDVPGPATRIEVSTGPRLRFVI